MPCDHLARFEVDIGYSAQQDANICLIPKDTGE